MLATEGFNHITTRLACTLITSTSWADTLRYASPSRSATDVLPGKAGLITEWTQQHKGTSADGGVSTSQTYAFSYDKAGRLTGSTRYDGASTTANNTLTERDITYDRSGNLLTLNRYDNSSATTPAEALSFSYTGPKRSGWTYDSHGNVTADPAGSMGLAWNAIGLPRAITGSGSASTQRSYLADGSLAQVSDGSTTRIYLGNMVFTQNGGTITLESAAWDGGLLLPGSGTDKVLYYVRDHLGSTRVVKDGSGNIRQRYDYYPYGSVSRAWSSNSSNTPDKRYRFGGKEITGSALSALTASSVPYLDFGARLYTPGTAMWLSQDPMAESYYPMTPYMYCAGSPGNVVDLLGMTYYYVNGEYYTIEDGYFDTILASQEEYDLLKKYFESTPWTDYYPLRDSFLGRSGSFEAGNEVMLAASYSFADRMYPLFSLIDIGLSTGSFSSDYLSGFLYNKDLGRWFGGKKFYGMNYNGNQHTWLQKNVLKTSKFLRGAGSFLSLVGIGYSLNDLKNATNDTQLAQATMDLIIGSLGFFPYVGPGLNLFWSFGGRRLFNNYTNNVIPMQMETGVLGLPSTLPFK